MIHTGSRGLGHQVCTDALSACDRQAACRECSIRGAGCCVLNRGSSGMCCEVHASVATHLVPTPDSLCVCCASPDCTRCAIWNHVTACRAMARAKVKLVDRQLACMPIGSPEGQDYLGAMKAAANFAFGNRWAAAAGWGMAPWHARGHAQLAVQR